MQNVKWFDGHLDLAYLAQHGRDLSQAADACGGGLQPAAVTFPALHAGNVQAAFATIFVQRRVPEEEARQKCVDPQTGAWTYSNSAEAFAAATGQIGIYQTWARSGRIDIVPAMNHWGGQDRLKVVLLLEGAMALREVEEFRSFYEAGVRVVSLSWLEGSAWAGGDNSGGDVTAGGRKLIAELDRLGCVHDVSHLSEAAFWTLLSVARGPKIASHSNARAQLPGKKFPERNLSNEQVRALVASGNGGGIIGLNLFSPFLVSGPDAPPRASVHDLLRHIKHLEDLVGRRDFLALGSDFDGGYPRTAWAEGLDGPETLGRLAEALAANGWSDAEIHRFAWQNWVDVMRNIGVEMEG